MYVPDADFQLGDLVCLKTDHDETGIIVGVMVRKTHLVYAVSVMHDEHMHLAEELDLIEAAPIESIDKLGAEHAVERQPAPHTPCDERKKRPAAPVPLATPSRKKKKPPKKKS